MKGGRKKEHEPVAIWQDIEKLSLSWDSAKELFHYDRIDSTFESLLPQASLRAGAIVFFAAAIIAVILAFLSSIGMTYFEAFRYETIAELHGADIEPEIDFSGLVPYSLYLLLFIVPFSMVFTLVYEWVAWRLLKLTGGKGEFKKQYQLASILTLSMSMVMALELLAPVPFLSYLAFFAFWLLFMYFGFFVRCRAYALVHDISFLHAFVIFVVVSAVAIPIAFFAIQNAVGLFNVPLPAQSAGV